MVRVHWQARLVLRDLPVADAEVSRRFYRALLGSDDVVGGVSERRVSSRRFGQATENDPGMAGHHDCVGEVPCWFAVEDLERVVRELTALGGVVVGVPDRRMVAMVDPDGCPIGLVEADRRVVRLFRWANFRRPTDWSRQPRRRDRQ